LNASIIREPLYSHVLGGLLQPFLVQDGPTEVTDDYIRALTTKRVVASVALVTPGYRRPEFPFVPLPTQPATQLVYAAWGELLQGYAKPKLKRLLDGIKFGVRLGYTGQRDSRCTVVRANHPSAELPFAKELIDAEIAGELAKGRMAGPFALPASAQHRRQRGDHMWSSPAVPFAFFMTSPVAVVPKPGGDGWRIIDDLSKGDNAVNASIDEKVVKLRYEQFQAALDMVVKLGRGCELAKIDWKSAFRQIAVHADDCCVLGISWRGKLFFRLVLPFGIRSAPFLFTEYAAALIWKMRSLGFDVTYYLDDILLGGAKGTGKCAAAVAELERLGAKLGIQYHPTKRDGPTTTIVFRGIGIDTIRMVLFIPEDKVVKANRAIAAVLSAHNRHAFLKQLQKCVGLLNFLAMAVPNGRAMMRRLYAFFKKKYAESAEEFTIPVEVWEDLVWWQQCVQFTHQRTIFPIVAAEDSFQIHTDACQTGGGAVLFDRSFRIVGWFAFPWRSLPLSESMMASMPALEAFAFVVALLTFSPAIAGRRLLLSSDALTAVDALAWESSSSQHLTVLLRVAYATAINSSVLLRVVHIQGTRNILADKASRLFVDDDVQAMQQRRQQLEELGLSQQLEVRPIIPAWLISQRKPADMLQQAFSTPLAQCTLPASNGGESFVKHTA